MIEEEKQPETPASTGEASEDNSPEVLEEPTVEVQAVEEQIQEAEGSSTQEADETNYEAAFIELRSAYAAKERELEGLKKQVEESNGQYMRIAADFENFRRRTQKEKEELEQQAKINTINELLPVVDNFERARSHLKPQSDGEMNIHKSYQGVYKDMVDRLKKVGVSPMRAEGKEFDPNLHEAVMRQPTSEHPEGTVVEELVRGYMLGEKVLRHAMVKVAAPPEDEEPANTDAGN